VSPTLEATSPIPRKLHGYDPATVDALFAELNSARDELVAECEKLRARVMAIRAELSSSSDLERAMREVFVTAQREAEDLRANAAREVEAINEEAKKRAEGTDEWLDQEADRIRAEIAAIHALEQDLRASTRGLLLEVIGRLGQVETESGPAEIQGVETPAVTETPVAAPIAAEPEPPAAEPILPVTQPELPETEAVAVDETPTEIHPATLVAGAGVVAADVGPSPPAIEEPPTPSLDDDTVDIPLVPDATEAAEPQLPLAEPAAPPGGPPGAPSAPARAFPLRAVLAAVGILVAGAAIAILIWQLRSDDESDGTAVTVTVANPVATETVELTPSNPPETQSSGGPATTAPAETAPADTAGEGTVPPAETAPAETAPAETAGTTEALPESVAPAVNLLLRAAAGDVWVSVHRGSAGGKLLYEGFLFQGDSRRFRGEQIWMRIGNPTNLVARLNGQPLDLPQGTANVLVTSDGAETLALG
jgi:hypothetical protein